MTRRLAAPEGIPALPAAQPHRRDAHASIMHNLAFRQLTMRGKRKASGEWKLICAVHNLMTAITRGHLTRQALASLAG